MLLEARPELRHPLSEPGAHYVLLEAATASPVLKLDEAVTALFEVLFSEGFVIGGTIAASGQQSNDFWQLRESIPEAEIHHGGSVKHDVSVRTSRLPEFVQKATAVVTKHAEDARLSIYGHVGDGNVHFNVLSPARLDAEAFKA